MIRRTTMLAVLAALALPATAAAALEKPVTEAAKGVTGTEATLHGELNPGASATAGYYFSYNTNGGCQPGSTSTPGEEATGEKIAVSTLVTGLEPRREYTFCVHATNAEAGEDIPGSPESFKTPSVAPAVDSTSGSPTSPFAATLEAQVNPENQVTTGCSFEYGTLTVGEHTVECSPSQLEGFGDQGVSAAVEGLSPETTYHFRVVVKNATGTTEGSEGELTTPAPEAPRIDSESATPVSPTEEALEAQISPNFVETTYKFEYATNEALAGPTVLEGAGPLPPVGEDQPASVALSGLAAHTTYFYRVVAENNKAQKTEGGVQSFTTDSAPVAVTGSPQAIERHGAQLAGASVDPGGQEATYAFHYIDQAGYEAGLAEDPEDPYKKGATLLPGGSVPAGNGPVAVASVKLGELRAGTVYHYALVAKNATGETVGPDAAFETLPATPPVATTAAATGVTQLSATLNGSVDTRELPTVVSFEFGASPALGSSVPATTGAGNPESAAAVFEGDLEPGTTYYFRTVASNEDGTSTGATMSFTTAGFPAPVSGFPARPLIPFTPISQITSEEETANGGSGGGTGRPLTNKQKLAKALKACHKKHGNARKTCEKQAHKRFGTHKKKK